MVDKTFLILHERGMSKIGKIGFVCPESSKKVFKLFEYEITFSTDVSFLGKCYPENGHGLPWFLTLSVSGSLYHGCPDHRADSEWSSQIRDFLFLSDNLEFAEVKVIWII